MTPRARSRKKKDYPENLYSQTKGSREYFFYRHPITRQQTNWGAVDKKKAFAAARALNAKFFESEDLIQKVSLEAQGLSKGATFAHVIDKYRTEQIPKLKDAKGTIKNKQYRLNRIERDLGKHVMQTYTLRELAEYMDESFARDAYKKHRQTLIDLYAFARTKGLYTHRDNPAEALQASKLDDEKDRQRLDLAGFKAVYDFAETPQWMKDAMDLAIITLQGRNEIVKARFDDVKDGHIHFIRQKTEGKTEKAFIRLPVTPKLEEIIKRCRARDQFVSPFLIARKPERMVRGHLSSREHWTQILPPYLTKAFQSLRDATGHFDHLQPEERPTFHEIRALGGDLYLEQGYSKEYVNMLYGHTKLETTEIYLKGHGRINWSLCSAELDYDKAFSESIVRK